MISLLAAWFGWIWKSWEALVSGDPGGFFNIVVLTGLPLFWGTVGTRWAWRKWKTRKRHAPVELLAPIAIDRASFAKPVKSTDVPEEPTEKRAKALPSVLAKSPAIAVAPAVVPPTVSTDDDPEDDDEEEEEYEEDDGDEEHSAPVPVAAAVSQGVPLSKYKFTPRQVIRTPD